MTIRPKRAPKPRSSAKAHPLAEDRAKGGMTGPSNGSVGDQPDVSWMRPELAHMLPKYELIRDCLEGSYAIKSRDFALLQGRTVPPFGIDEFANIGPYAVGGPYAYGITARYLPQPDPTNKSLENQERYRQYIMRAVFYNVTGRTLESLIGAVFLRAPIIAMPVGIADLEQDMTGGGVSLIQVAKQSVHYVMAYGRLGLLVDYPIANDVITVAQKQTGQFKPTVVLFTPWQVINWRTRSFGSKQKLILVTIMEVAIIADDGFKETTQEQYRVLRLTPNEVYTVELWRRDNSGGDNYILYQPPTAPTDANGNTFNEIPFKFIGPEDNDVSVDEPPIYDMADLNIGHYRNSADYEEACYITGQPTLAIGGLTEQWVDTVLKGAVNLGSRAAIVMPEGGKAELLQAEPNNLPGEAMAHKEAQMVALGARLVENKKVQRTATEAGQDESKEQSVLASATANVAQGLVWALQICCAFENVDYTDDTLKCELNTELDLTSLSPEQRKMLLGEWEAGGISFTEYRHNLKRGGIAYQDDTIAMKEIADNPPPAKALEAQAIVAQSTNDKTNP